MIAMVIGDGDAASKVHDVAGCGSSPEGSASLHEGVVVLVTSPTNTDNKGADVRPMLVNVSKHETIR